MYPITLLSGPTIGRDAYDQRSKPATFAMRSWEKNKKEVRRQDGPEQQPRQTDHKKKKLKPVEKIKYRAKSYAEDEDEV
jgi:hypothetical protein